MAYFNTITTKQHSTILHNVVLKKSITLGPTAKLLTSLSFWICTLMCTYFSQSTICIFLSQLKLKELWSARWLVKASKTPGLFRRLIKKPNHYYELRLLIICGIFEQKMALIIAVHTWWRGQNQSILFHYCTNQQQWIYIIELVMIFFCDGTFFQNSEKNWY